MFDFARRRSTRLLAAVLLALTTVAVGFAHRPLRLEPRGYGAEAALHVLPDGTLPALCVWDDVGGHDHGGSAPDAGFVCVACVLAAAPGLGAVAPAVVPVPTGRVIARVTIRSDRAPIDRMRPIPTSRGPPVA